jgi:hypothetical protein
MNMFVPVTDDPSNGGGKVGREGGKSGFNRSRPLKSVNKGRLPCSVPYIAHMALH